MLSPSSICIVHRSYPFATLCVAQTEQPTRSAESAKLLKSDPLHVFSESVQQLSNTRYEIGGAGADHGLRPHETRRRRHDTAFLEAQRGVGAGVILSSDGYIVTNAHVVEGARHIRVRLQGHGAGADQDAPPHGPIEAKLVGWTS